MSNLPVKEVMTTALVTVNRNDDLASVAQLFATHNFHHLPVVDEEGTLEGILSLTDIERLKVGATFFRQAKKEEYTQTLFETMRACEVMTKDVIALQPSDSIFKAFQIFRQNKFRALPIVGKGMLLGIITPLDILEYFFNKAVV